MAQHEYENDRRPRRKEIISILCIMRPYKIRIITRFEVSRKFGVQKFDNLINIIYYLLIQLIILKLVCYGKITHVFRKRYKQPSLIGNAESNTVK